MEKRRRITVPISSLYLDLHNPRHAPAVSERAAIARLVSEEGVIPLAKDIATRGELSPIETIGVLPHPSIARAYIVEEGNRRVAALKILRDCELCPDQTSKAAIRRALENGTVPSGRVEVLEFIDSDDAHVWKSLRHGGEQRGVGAKKWDAVQKTRHATNAGRSDPNRMAQYFIEYAESRGLITAEQKRAIAITTITRYLSTPVVRHVLGFADADDELRIKVNQDEFDVAAKRFLLDSIGRDAKVNSRTNAKERKAYVESLSREGVAPREVLPAPVRPSASTAARPSVKRGGSAALPS